MEPLKKRQRLTPALTSLRDAPRSNLLKGGGVKQKRRAIELKMCVVNIREGGGAYLASVRARADARCASTVLSGRGRSGRLRKGGLSDQLPAALGGEGGRAIVDAFDVDGFLAGQGVQDTV